MPFISRKYHLSVVTTTDPKAGLLPRLIEEIVFLARNHAMAIEILVVDDLVHLSNTPPIELPSDSTCVVRLIQPQETGGQLAATLLGIRAATGDCIATIDPDMHQLVCYFPSMLEQLKFGGKLIHAVRECRDIGVSRRIGSFVTNLMIASSTGIFAHDLNSPLIMLKRTYLLELLLSVPENINPRLYIYATLGSNIKEYPVNCPDSSGVSQYTILMLVKLFARLSVDCIRILKLRLAGRFRRA